MSQSDWTSGPFSIRASNVEAELVQVSESDWTLIGSAYLAITEVGIGACHQPKSVSDTEVTVCVHAVGCSPHTHGHQQQGSR
jgi:hypothetical protein